MLPAKGAENRPAVELTQVRHVGFLLHHGRVAELADAQDSGSCVRKDVRVQVPPRPRRSAENTRQFAIAKVRLNQDEDKSAILPLVPALPPSKPSLWLGTHTSDTPKERVPSAC